MRGETVSDSGGATVARPKEGNARLVHGMSARVARVEGGVVSRKIAGEMLLVPISGSLADLRLVFALNPLAEHIWEQLDGERMLGDIRDGIVACFEVEAPQAERDLLELVDELLGEGLAVEAS